jgi:hypothetical protein
MKYLLSTTALITSVTFGGAAFAQVPADPVQQASSSLLDNILSNANELSASISNVSQNLNAIDGSIDVTTSRSLTEMNTIVSTLSGSTGFGSYSQAGSGVFGRDIPDSLLAVLDPLTLSLGDLATTAIGTLQSGNMTGTFDSDGLVSRVETSSTGSTTSANSMAEQYAGIADTVAMQNISVNSGAIDGSVALILADVNTTAGNIATTAIGALQSGAMEATISGNLGGTTEATSAIVSALVGTTP